MTARKELSTLRLVLKLSGTPMIYSTILLTAHSAFAVNAARQQVNAGAGAYHKSFSLSRGFRGIKVWSERLYGIQTKRGTQETPLSRMPNDIMDSLVRLTVLLYHQNGRLSTTFMPLFEKLFPVVSLLP